MLRGIFSGHVGTKDVTRLALEAEERSDYQTAQQLYKEVNNNIVVLVYTLYPQALGKEDWPDAAPTQEEEDLWDQSLLNVSDLYLGVTKQPFCCHDTGDFTL